MKLPFERGERKATVKIFCKIVVGEGVKPSRIIRLLEADGVEARIYMNNFSGNATGKFRGYKG